MCKCGVALAAVAAGHMNVGKLISPNVSMCVEAHVVD